MHGTIWRLRRGTIRKSVRECADCSENSAECTCSICKQFCRLYWHNLQIALEFRLNSWTICRLFQGNLQTVLGLVCILLKKYRLWRFSICPTQFADVDCANYQSAHKTYISTYCCHRLTSAKPYEPSSHEPNLFEPVHMSQLQCATFSLPTLTFDTFIWDVFVCAKVIWTTVIFATLSIWDIFIWFKITWAPIVWGTFIRANCLLVIERVKSNSNNIQHDCCL